MLKKKMSLKQESLRLKQKSLRYKKKLHQILTQDGIEIERVVFVGVMKKDQNLLLKDFENWLKILRKNYHRHTILRRYGNKSKPRSNFCG